MRKILIALAVTAAFCCNVVNAAELKIGVVDLKKVFTESPQVAAERTKLQNQFEPKGKEVEGLRKTLQTDVDKLKKDAAVMKDEEKKTLQTKITDEQNKLQDVQTSLQRSFLTAESQSMQDVSKKIQEAIDATAKSKGINLVMVKGAGPYNSVAYSDPSLDITPAVQEQLKGQK
jgi:outer membrane protein